MQLRLHVKLYVLDPSLAHQGMGKEETVAEVVLSQEYFSREEHTRGRAVTTR